MRQLSLLKICPKCGIEKPISEFHKNTRRSDGLATQCKACLADYHKEYYAKIHPIIPTEKTCNQCHKTKPASDFGFHRGTKDGLQQKCRICLKENQKLPEHQEYSKEYQEAYRKRTRVQRSAYMHTYRKVYRHKPEVRQKTLEYIKRPHVKLIRNRNNNRYHAQKLAAPGDFTLEQWRTLCELAHNHCLCCGASEITIDHIKPLSHGGCNCIHNLQPLCLRCNARKNNFHETDYRTPEILAWLATIPHVHARNLPK